MSMPTSLSTAPFATDTNPRRGMIKRGSTSLTWVLENAGGISLPLTQAFVNGSNSLSSLGWCKHHFGVSQSYN